VSGYEVERDDGSSLVVTTPGESGMFPDATSFGVYLTNEDGGVAIASSPNRSEALAQLDRFIAALGEARERLATS
jgi:hypothetical protein